MLSFEEVKTRLGYPILNVVLDESQYNLIVKSATQPLSPVANKNLPFIHTSLMTRLSMIQYLMQYMDYRCKWVKHINRSTLLYYTGHD